ASNISNGSFVARPSRRAETDDDSRTAALIYRDVKEYVVGHTCSAQALVEHGTVTSLRTSWLPAVVVPAVSDRGDSVFEELYASPEHKVLEARWLAEAPADELVAALESLASAYTRWIKREEQRVTEIASGLRP